MCFPLDGRCMEDVLSLRCMGVVCASSMLIFNLFRAQPVLVAVRVNALFVGLNLVFIARLLLERRDIALDPLETALWEQCGFGAFLSKVEFRELVAVGERRSYAFPAAAAAAGGGGGGGPHTDGAAAAATSDAAAAAAAAATPPLCVAGAPLVRLLLSSSSGALGSFNVARRCERGETRPTRWHTVPLVPPPRAPSGATRRRDRDGRRARNGRTRAPARDGRGGRFHR